MFDLFASFITIIVPSRPRIHSVNWLLRCCSPACARVRLNHGNFELMPRFHYLRLTRKFGGVSLYRAFFELFYA